MARFNGLPATYQRPNGNIIQRFNQFRNAFSGDPQQQIQQLLESGRITEAQLNQAVNTAKQIKSMLGI